jgi:DnaK suppressor protein
VPAKATSGAAKASGPAAKSTGDHAKKAAPAKAGVATSGTSGAVRADRAPDEPELDGAFLAEQKKLLVQERAGYVRQAEELKAEADSLALEHEPGDVQFDEEGGEGGTSNVDRELDLVLSAQARSAILEIDRAMVKIEAGTYGRCEQCGRPIPQARLQALPYASLCVACKSGGLSRR